MARPFRRSGEVGATMVEYGIIVSLIVLLVFSLVQLLGVSVRDMFQGLVDLM
jgi:Flp pilus assembly pilin Flp